MGPLRVHLCEHEGEGDQKWTEVIYQVQIMPDQTAFCSKTKNLITFHNKMGGFVDKERALDITYLDFSNIFCTIFHNTFVSI